MRLFLHDSGSDPSFLSLLFFFFNVPATTEIYTLSLHDALPISKHRRARQRLRSVPRECRWVRSEAADRKSTRLNSSHTVISYAVFCLKKKNGIVMEQACEMGARDS